MSYELPLGRDLLKKTGKIRVDVLAVRRVGKHSVAMVFRHEKQLYQDRFDGDVKECDTLELEAAGKDVFATIVPDGKDKGYDPEIDSVEVVGND